MIPLLQALATRESTSIIAVSSEDNPTLLLKTLRALFLIYTFLQIGFSLRVQYLTKLVQCINIQHTTPNVYSLDNY